MSEKIYRVKMNSKGMPNFSTAEEVDAVNEWIPCSERLPEEVMQLPTIELVRCKECRWGKPYSDKQLECDALGLGGLKFPNDFCSYGEREGE